MSEIYLKKLEPLTLMYIKAETFPEGITPAWDKLDKTLKSIGGREFYGAAKMIDGKMEYRACVVPLDENEHKQLGMDTFSIPAGNYAAKNLIDWHSHIPEIREIFMELNSKFAANPGLYNLEYYLNNKELIIMLPIFDKEIEKF
jgi:predicted transcriptional regulator YdeE